MFEKPRKLNRRTESVTLMVTQPEREALDNISRESGLSISDLIRIGLRRVVAEHKQGVLTDE